MIQIAITPEIISRAKKKAAQVGNLQGSITGRKRHVVGAIGEVIVADLTGATESSTYDYDIVRDGERIDVKTKRCNTRPYPHYECSVAAHGATQECDNYVFVRILGDMSVAWILGEISKSDFYTKATKYKRGDIDPANSFESRADCYNLPISELSDVKKSISI